MSHIGEIRRKYVGAFKEATVASLYPPYDNENQRHEGTEEVEFSCVEGVTNVTAIRRGIRGLMSLAMVAVFIMASQYAAARTVTGAIVGGKTSIANFGACTAEVYPIQTPSTVDINNGDDVKIDYRVYWWDNRTYLASQYAYHNFTLDVYYDGSYYDEDHHYVTTLPNDYGSHVVSVTITGAQVGKSVAYDYYASIKAPLPGMYTCDVPRSAHGNFTLV